MYNITIYYKHATPLTLLGCGEASLNPATLWKNLGWNLSPSNTTCTVKYGYIWWPLYDGPQLCTPISELHPPANQSPRFGSTASRQGIRSTHGFFSLQLGAGHPWNQQGFEIWNFHPKNVWNRWNLRSSVINRSVHIARPTFSTTSPYSGCYHVTTSHQTLPGGGGFCVTCAEIQYRNHLRRRKKIRNIFKIKLGLFLRAQTEFGRQTCAGLRLGFC